MLLFVMKLVINMLSKMSSFLSSESCMDPIPFKNMNPHSQVLRYTFAVLI